MAPRVMNNYSGGFVGVSTPPCAVGLLSETVQKSTWLQIRQFKHQTERKAQTVITREFSLLTFDSNVRIGRLTLQRNVATEVEDLRWS